MTRRHFAILEPNNVAATKALPHVKRLVILTFDQKQILPHDGEIIEVLPAWEWLG
ncbi:hypothetical protein AGMMS49960_18910 [Betaproteobacteria bacterium]|nr:hypothetical protein AGMMS49543_19410 [Betaproteobacteria bacterium]GHU03909.1 hypothetical protein AGMMS49960_18910 [Betaproteobacteria bacterium]GHU19907.1 hypothetical protein AGMMS50243_13080 [Betaproteobacteria bacterium]